MKLLGNIIWFIFGGFFAALAWAFVGGIYCITVIGIPIGVQCFKAASLVIMPFGKEVRYEGGFGSCLINIIWLIFGGLELCVGHLVIGLVYCITVIGIPFGMQHFKFAKLAFSPVGAKIVKAGE